MAWQKRSQDEVLDRQESYSCYDKVYRGIAKYKDHIYLILYQGNARYGPTIRLSFCDGSDAFWVSGEKMKYVDILKSFQEKVSLEDIISFYLRSL